MNCNKLFDRVDVLTFSYDSVFDKLDVFLFIDKFINILFIFLAIYTFYLFYKEIRFYNLLFGIFFIMYILSGSPLSMELNPSIHIVIILIQFIILIIAIILFFSNKDNFDNKEGVEK